MEDWEKWKEWGNGKIAGMETFEKIERLRDMERRQKKIFSETY